MEPLSWNTVPFRDESRNEIPESPGIYLFMIHPDNGSNLFICYPMYVGETKDGSSNRGLRVRYKEYLRYAKIHNSRPQIFELLNTYRGHIKFTYSELSDKTNEEIKEAEQKLMGAFKPPYNLKLEGEVKEIHSVY